MNLDTTITVRGVDPEVWKRFQQTVIGNYGNLYGFLGPALSQAMAMWLEQKSQPNEIDYERYKSKNTMRNMILGAMKDLRGEATIQQVIVFLTDKFGDVNPESISTSMADLAINGPPSSTYSQEQRVVERVSRGRYRLLAKTDSEPK